MLDGPKYVELTLLAENHLLISTVLEAYIFARARSSSGIVSLSVVRSCASTHPHYHVYVMLACSEVY